MLDPISNSRLLLICPMLARKIEQLADILGMDRPPIIFRITQGLRTWNDQAALYAQGRSIPGAIVTDAEPGHSWHNFGLAVDFVPMTAIGPDWNREHPCWQRIIQAGESLGLVAGAHFRSYPDWPHFQLTGKFPESPDDEVRQVFLDAGMSALWQEAGLLDS